MDVHDAREKFQRAETLYAQGQYVEALQVLDELDQNFPNTGNVLYPKALCLAGLGRNEEAAELCDRLINEFQDGRAQSLRSQLNVPAAGEFDGLTLDTDLLGDFDKPAPKRPVRVAEPNRMPLYAGVGGAAVLIVALVTLVYTGAVGSLLAKLKPETADSAMAKIMDASSKLTACAGSFQANADLSQPMPMKLNGTGDFDYLSSSGKPMFRVNAALAMENMGGMTQSFTIVSDGSTTYYEMNVMGQMMVMKMDNPGAAANTMAPTELVKTIKEIGELSLAKDEVVDNLPAYVFVVKPKVNASSMPPGMPELGDITVAVTKATGLPARIEVKDKTGKPLLTASTKNVVTNIGSSPDKFKYTPPEGVKVMDMADMQKMMPIPGMPMTK